MCHALISPTDPCPGLEAYWTTFGVSCDADAIMGWDQGPQELLSWGWGGDCRYFNAGNLPVVCTLLGVLNIALFGLEPWLSG